MHSLEKRFWSKAILTGNVCECWLWTGWHNLDGYGMFDVTSPAGRKIKWLAYRAAYELVLGPQPDGLQLDHLCRNRGCINPWHLEPVTGAENRRRGVGSEVTRARHAAKTACKYGHEFTPENTKLVPAYSYRPGQRRCRQCTKDRNAGAVN